MKFTTVIALISAATAVSAASNAGTPISCYSGPPGCCESLHTYGEKGESDDLVRLLGLSLAKGTPYGVNCFSLSASGPGHGGGCGSQTACCDNDDFNLHVNVGCIAINSNP